VDSKRNFLEVALTIGMETQIIAPADVLRHIEPDVLASHLPDDAKTSLLAASIKAGKMDPNLVFETLTPQVFAEHMPVHMLWSCIAEAADRVLKDDKPSSGLNLSSKTSSLLGDSKSSRRRPTPSRRPSRLGQSRSKPKSTVTGMDLENTDVSTNWPKDSLSDEVFGDWVEETMSSDNRRKR
jgi:hypothetical protein